jgi:hypothetical protein
MIGLMGAAFLAMFLWVIPELIGVFSEEAEDTFSEWVWDLPLWAILVIVVLFCVAGLLMIGASWHFLEGYGRRRRKEKE